MAADPFEGYAQERGGVIDNAVEITPSDSVDLATIPRGFWVGTSGNLKVTMKGGQTVTFKNIDTGYHGLRITRIWATGTTAADIVALW
jgi:hypothetical protein